MERANPASVVLQREWDADDTIVQWSLWEGCDLECISGDFLHVKMPPPRLHPDAIQRVDLLKRTRHGESRWVCVRKEGIAIEARLSPAAFENQWMQITE